MWMIGVGRPAVPREQTESGFKYTLDKYTGEKGLDAEERRCGLHVTGSCHATRVPVAWFPYLTPFMSYLSPCYQYEYLWSF